MARKYCTEITELFTSALRVKQDPDIRRHTLVIIANHVGQCEGCSNAKTRAKDRPKELAPQQRKNAGA